MLRVLHEEHRFSDLFVAHMVERHNHTQADLVDQLFNSSEQRLARALLLLARFGKKDKAEEVVPDISQETLAEMVGTTRSRVNFFMNKFRKLGFIDYNGSLRVHNSLLSVVLHDWLLVGLPSHESLLLVPSNQARVHFMDVCNFEQTVRSSLFFYALRPWGER
jgi:CRP/FNR family transcriptional regulator, cyclic AMP receptor protein